MMTKEQFCKSMIRNISREEGFEESDAHNHIYSSSTLAVCLEHLNLLKTNTEKLYASERGGILFTYYDNEKNDSFIISARDMIRMLPEK